MSKTIVINGDNFSDLESFYVEVDNVLTKDIEFKTGHNLDAFHDILCGGFGVFEYDESIELFWVNFSKSRSDLGPDLLVTLVRIIQGYDNIEFSMIE